MGKIEIKTERGLFGLGEEKEVIYEDEKKIGEIKQETTWCGEKIKNTYGEDGQKVSETRREEGWWGRSIEVTRDNHGQVIREKTHAPEGIIIRNYDAQKNLETITTHEKRILLDDRDVTKDNIGNIICITQHETDWLGRPIDVVYDANGNKISEVRAYDLRNNRTKIRHKQIPKKPTEGNQERTSFGNEQQDIGNPGQICYADRDEKDYGIREKSGRKSLDRKTSQKIERINAYAFNWDTPEESIKSIGIESELEIILLFKDSENSLVKIAAINKLGVKHNNTLRFSSVYDDSPLVRTIARKRLQELDLRIPLKKEFMPDYDLGITSKFHLRFLEIKSRCEENPDKKRKAEERLDEYFNGPKPPKTPPNNLLLKYQCSRCNHNWADTGFKETEESDCLFKCSEWETLHFILKLQRVWDYLINKKELFGKGKLIKSEKM